LTTSFQAIKQTHLIEIHFEIPLHSHWEHQKTLKTLYTRSSNVVKISQVFPFVLHNRKLSTVNAGILIKISTTFFFTAKFPPCNFLPHESRCMKTISPRKRKKLKSLHFNMIDDAMKIRANIFCNISFAKSLIEWSIYTVPSMFVGISRFMLEKNL
jgi:hypothetical protein